MMRVLDRLRAEIEIDLVHAISGALVVDQCARAELRNGEKAGTRDVFVASCGSPSGRHVRGDRKPGKVVAGEEAFRREIAVRVEIPFVNAFGFGQEANLTLCLRTQPSRMVALAFGSGMVADNGVVECALADGGAIEATPTVAGSVEAALNLDEHLVHPVVVKPGGLFEL